MSAPNRYPGICSQCGEDVPTRSGICLPGLDSKGRRWVILCGTCGGVSRTPGIVAYRIGDKTYTRNARGVCEDAPCCGCCTI